MVLLKFFHDQGAHRSRHDGDHQNHHKVGLRVHREVCHKIRNRDVCHLIRGFHDHHLGNRRVVCHRIRGCHDHHPGNHQVVCDRIRGCHDRHHGNHRDVCHHGNHQVHWLCHHHHDGSLRDVRPVIQFITTFIEIV